MDVRADLLTAEPRLRTRRMAVLAHRRRKRGEGRLPAQFVVPASGHGLDDVP